MLYLGDELAMVNDYSYRDDPGRAVDSRWVHRPRFDWARAAQRSDPETLPGRVFQTLRRLISVRASLPAFADGGTAFFDTGNPHVLGFVRHGQVLVLANFSEFAQRVAAAAIDPAWPAGGQAVDLVQDRTVSLGEGQIELEPYQFVWLKHA